MSGTNLSTVILVCGVIGVVTYVIGSGGGNAENIWRKVKLAGIGAVHMAFSKDKKFKAEVSVFFGWVGGWGGVGEGKVELFLHHNGQIRFTL